MRDIEKVNAEIEEVKKELENVHGTGTEVYARIVGYYRTVRNWNKGKREEYNQRLMFSSENERIEKTLSDCDCPPISGSLNFSSSENLSEKKEQIA